jgi:hypothetical protein
MKEEVMGQLSYILATGREIRVLSVGLYMMMIMNDDWVLTWKKAVVCYFKTPSRNYPGENKTMKI